MLLAFFFPCALLFFDALAEAGKANGTTNTSATTTALYRGQVRLDVLDLGRMVIGVVAQLVRLAKRDLGIEVEAFLLVEDSVQRPGYYVEVGSVVVARHARWAVGHVLGRHALQERLGRVDLVLHGANDAVEQKPSRCVSQRSV